MESRPSLHLGVVVIKKGAFGSPSTKVADFTYNKVLQLWFSESGSNVNEGVTSHSPELHLLL